MIDRLFCLLLGHTWERVPGCDAKQCPHCLTRMSAIQVVTFWRSRLLDVLYIGHSGPFYVKAGSNLKASDALRQGWPKRVWRVR